MQVIFKEKAEKFYVKIVGKTARFLCKMTKCPGATSRD